MQQVRQAVTWMIPVSGRQVTSHMEWTDLDPLAVKMTFHYPHTDIEWMFALDLLTSITQDGHPSAGNCDVYTSFERKADGYRLFILQLSSPEGSIRLLAPMEQVIWFTAQVENRLPSDDVVATMVDYELAEILKEEGA